MMGALHLCIIFFCFNVTVNGVKMRPVPGKGGTIAMSVDTEGQLAGPV